MSIKATIDLVFDQVRELVAAGDWFDRVFVPCSDGTVAVYRKEDQFLRSIDSLLYRQESQCVFHTETGNRILFMRMRHADHGEVVWFANLYDNQVGMFMSLTRASEPIFS